MEMICDEIDIKEEANFEINMDKAMCEDFIMKEETGLKDINMEDIDEKNSVVREEPCLVKVIKKEAYTEEKELNHKNENQEKSTLDSANNILIVNDTAADELELHCDFCDFVYGNSDSERKSEIQPSCDGQSNMSVEYKKEIEIEKKSLSQHSSSRLNEKKSTIPAKRFKCQDCNYSSSNKYELIRHLRVHADVKPFKCNYCDYTGARKSFLINHLRTHTGEKPFQCNYCDYAATQKPTLERHLRTHTGEKLFKCTYCDYAGAEKTYLQIHLRTHTGEKPYKCNYCKFVAAQKTSLEHHLRTHTGEKPFKCNYCDYAAIQKASLEQHLRTHTGKKLYKCDYCDYTAARDFNLKRHLATHTGEKSFKCTYCNYAATKKAYLQSHLRNHTGEKRFKCNYCDYATAVETNLTYHIRTHNTGDMGSKNKNGNNVNSATTSKGEQILMSTPVDPPLLLQKTTRNTTTISDCTPPTNMAASQKILGNIEETLKQSFLPESYRIRAQSDEHRAHLEIIDELMLNFMRCLHMETTGSQNEDRNKLNQLISDVHTMKLNYEEKISQLENKIVQITENYERQISALKVNSEDAGKNSRR